MPYNSMGVWEDDDYASGGMTPSGGSGAVSLPSAPASSPSAGGNTSWQQFMSANPSVATNAPSDYWIPPTASFGNDPSGQINQQNPFADPAKPFVQTGTTGGHIDGIGTTIGQGRSTTPAQAQAALDALIAQFGQADAYDWLRRNPGDFTRGAESLASERTGDRERGTIGSVSGSGGSGSGGSSPWGGGSGQSWGDNWFTDPGTQQLESVIKNQLNAVTNPNPNDPQSQLMAFLMKRFGELSNSNGYSPEELAMLRTQGAEPIEALRASSQQRELERTARAGYMPTSGLTRINQQQNDLDYDRLRTQASRDLAVQNVNERTNRLNQALQLGQTALNTQRGTNATQLQLSTLLQQLPVQALQQAMSVVNGTGSPESLASLVNQIVAQQQQQQYYQQQQNAGYWANIMQTALGALG